MPEHGRRLRKCNANFVQSAIALLSFGVHHSALPFFSRFCIVDAQLLPRRDAFLQKDESAMGVHHDRVGLLGKMFPVQFLSADNNADREHDPLAAPLLPMLSGWWDAAC